MKKTFLGTGWKFPPSFNKETLEVDMVSEEDDINESLNIIFNTMVGERIMFPKFGSELHKLVFEEKDATFLGVLEDAVQHAILHFEPRIHLEDIQIFEDESVPNAVFISIDYSIIITNTRTNMVFPFYFQEGTLL